MWRDLCFFICDPSRNIRNRDQHPKLTSPAPPPFFDHPISIPDRHKETPRTFQTPPARPKTKIVPRPSVRLPASSIRPQKLLRQYGIDPGLMWDSVPAEALGPGTGTQEAGAQPKDLRYFPSAGGTPPPPPATTAAAAAPPWGGHKSSAPPAVDGLGIVVVAGEGGDGGNGGGFGPGGLSAVARVCGACGKAFSSEAFLSKHMDRRHPDLVRRRQHDQEQETSTGRDGGGTNHSLSQFTPPKKFLKIVGSRVALWDFHR